MMELEKQNSHSLEPPAIQEKTTSDSRNRIIYDFTSNAALKNLYIDACGNVSMGKLFEDLDALAGNIAYVHVDDGEWLREDWTGTAVCYTSHENLFFILFMLSHDHIALHLTFKLTSYRQQ